MSTKIKSFEHACEVLGIAEALPEVTALPVTHQKAIIANYKLYIIFEATNKLNNDWKPDWSNWDQYKYYPWFRYGSGVGFSCDDYGCVNAGTLVGSRLCCGTRESAIHIGKTFGELYNDVFQL